MKISQRTKHDENFILREYLEFIDDECIYHEIYNEKGNLTTSIDEKGNRTTYRYTNDKLYAMECNGRVDYIIVENHS